MKLTNEAMDRIIDVMAPLNETGRLGYAIAYNLRKMVEEAQEYIDMKDKLLHEYGEKTETGYFLDPDKSPEKYEAFKNEMGDIPKIEHVIEVLKVSPKELYSGNLTSGQMANLMWMVDDSKA